MHIVISFQIIKGGLSEMHHPVIMYSKFIINDYKGEISDAAFCRLLRFVLFRDNCASRPPTSPQQTAKLAFSIWRPDARSPARLPA